LFCFVFFFNRGLFIIDDKGILRQITINDLPVGRSVDEVLRLVQAFQYTDKHGEGKESVQQHGVTKVCLVFRKADAFLVILSTPNDFVFFNQFQFALQDGIQEVIQ